MQLRKCLMCGMELTPVTRTYNYPNKKKKTVTATFTPKSFCDNKCQHYFMKRVWADEMGIKLAE